MTQPQYRLPFWRRPMTRIPYTVWCVATVLFFHTVARFVSQRLFHIQISIDKPFAYLLQANRALLSLRWADKDAPLLIFLAVLLLLLTAALMLFSARRLRDACLPLWLLAGLLIPVLNLLLFILLCLWPSLVLEAEDSRRERLASAVLAAAAGAIAGVLLVFVSARLGRYGWALFVVLPFAMGLMAAWIYTRNRARSARDCIAVSMLSLLLLGGLLVGVALEGVICVLMAAAIAVPLGMLGAYVGYLLQGAWRTSAVASLLVVLCVPGIMGAEYLDPPVAPRIEIVTVFEIAAPPEIVWRNLVAFPEIGPPSELLFRSGVSYPREAHIIGQGVGAFRLCVFSTGTFVERITAWEENRRLDFVVLSQPSTMQEMSPYADLHPPHLDGYLHPEEARFTLTPLPGGRTRLEGRSFYKNEMWPMTYWRLWSDAIIKRVHRRVFGQIKRLSEQQNRFLTVAAQ